MSKELDAQAIALEFQKRSPWVTKFVIQGHEYGGQYDPLNDRRIDFFFRSFPQTQAVLELAALEGGHSFVLAPRVRKVVALEGRRRNLAKARFVQECLGVKNVEFIKANLERVRLADYGQFDAVLCIGILYHLPRPWKLLDQIAQVSRNVLIWTHYVTEEKATESVHGLSGCMISEGGYLNIFTPTSPLSGLSRWSFWPSRPSLIEMIRRSGFATVKVLEDEPNHQDGPAMSVAAIAP